VGEGCLTINWVSGRIAYGRSREVTRISVLLWAGALPERQRSGGGGASGLPPEGETGKGENQIPCAAG
jgi:hypothetical protein